MSDDVAHLYTDTSTSLVWVAYLGTGGTTRFLCPWPSSVLSNQHITFPELLPIVLGVDSDFLPIRHRIEKQTSKVKLVTSLFRQQVLLFVKFRIDLRATHIAGTDNVLLCALSLLQVQLFRSCSSSGRRANARPGAAYLVVLQDQSAKIIDAALAPSTMKSS